MEMIEKVARAIDEAYGGVSLAFTVPQATDTRTIRAARLVDTTRALSAARAAIEAMMDPTDEMIEAIRSEMYGVLSGHDGPETSAPRAYAAMIDAALSPRHDLDDHPV